MLDRFKVCGERSDDDESFIAKMNEDREWFLGVCLRTQGTDASFNTR